MNEKLMDLYEITWQKMQHAMLKCEAGCVTPKEVELLAMLKQEHVTMREMMHTLHAANRTINEQSKLISEQSAFIKELSDG